MGIIDEVSYSIRCPRCNGTEPVRAVEHGSNWGSGGWSSFDAQLFNLTIEKQHGMPTITKATCKKCNVAAEVGDAHELADADGFMSHPRDHHFVPTFEEYVLIQGDHLADRIRIRFLQTALDNENIGGRLNNMNWNVLDLSGARFRLLTSDWPLGRNINGERIALTLPICPRALFTATTHPDIYRAISRTRPNELVRTINAEVVSQARLHVYSSDRTQDQFVTNNMSSRIQQQPFFPTLARGRRANAPIVRA